MLTVRCGICHASLHTERGNDCVILKRTKTEGFATCKVCAQNAEKYACAKVEEAVRFALAGVEDEPEWSRIVILKRALKHVGLSDE